MSLMEQFADPTYFEGLSMSEKLTGATVTMCMGLGITFIVLFVLWGCIALMARITHKPVKTVSSEAKKEAAPAVGQTKSEDGELSAVIMAAAVAAAEDDSELVAVIAAAVAAMENTVVSNLVVRKITRVSGPTNAWASAGLSECINSRKV